MVFEDYVLVIDANYPSGAREVIAKIRELTDKPIRFAFDTHHHGDHAYGNQVWVDEGATPVAHTGVLEEMKRLETGLFGDKPGRWEDEAKEREDVRGSKLKPPTLLFPDTLIFDDGKHRVELRHFGVAHTKGDGVAWLPKEKILFTGDMAVNGPYNYVGDGNVASWIRDAVERRGLGASKVGPGHGPLGDASILRGSVDCSSRSSRAAVTAASKGEDAGGVPGGDSRHPGRADEEQPDRAYIGDGFAAQVGEGLQRAHRADTARSAGRGAGREHPRRLASRAVRHGSW